MSKIITLSKLVAGKAPNSYGCFLSIPHAATGEGGATWSSGLKRVFAILVKLRMAKIFLLDQQLQLTINQIGTKNW